MHARSGEASRSSTLERVHGEKGSASMSRITELRLYGSPDHIVKGQPPVDPTKDGIRRLVGKYESPENLCISPTVIRTSMNGLDKPGSVVGGPAMSDCSSDISDATPTWPSTANVAATNFSEGVTEQDILQVEMFYKSHKTEVCVCRCLANLYFGGAKNAAQGDTWEFHNTGIPVLVLDSGDHHRNRKLRIIMAEKGTGFTLWKEGIDHLSKYSVPSANFHTMYLTTDHTKQAGLSFDDSNAAVEFYSFISTLTSDPNDDLFNLSKKKNKKKKKDKSKPKYKAPKKTDISQPCCFVHVTKLERPDFPPPPSRLGDLSHLMGAKLVIPRSTSSEVSDDSTSHSAASEHS
ncbi:uncharacterized protein LOC124292494 [Haliotis rubra]|uniref:uncharacterized protein LOC124292494 n=1 Tax=Haliotis rubra TaxID=36100 RepID=UPI001EE5870C|nr:uncharacterized protein LOC124292494 [Haliotis rubra]XP_046585542.1 uncharacterized protein LOC124292494 [Haliotis rubra]XP_046585543.1 uncharacterized protein LOC124292494 [Haliotis rubra]XP_046585544.1 uncharacterized protein LOC124292494 [Haliotis rubra]XP_046585545.1 uncharacterized protein LOC124292494 [Haliotis rubra]XP_046585547.1 uncharacterized protein LOC124292494 [Haliotis rubra]XP_046585548.1 uncharacterized protein LOC124292494 [Haliotis rubra]XP_046585549.1 uncharacterized p